MEDLVKMVTQRIGVDEAQARGAIDTVVGFIKERLPEPIAAQVENVVSGGIGGVVGSLGDVAGSVAKGIGGILGGK